MLRLQEGTTVRLNVHNQLEEDTSIHWHGLLVPFQLDGVPGVSFPGVKPGETFTAEFPVRQSGTYWRSEEHTSELQSLMRISYAVFCLKTQKHKPLATIQRCDAIQTNRCLLKSTHYATPR